ncbi:MAG TPA: glycoside hydrolase family 88 protein [Acidobacteriota bacterium]
MQRRDFLMLAPAGAAAATMVGGGKPTAAGEKAEAATRDKVRQAMLCMQRDAWEQGVAAQALLEAGERDLVILLAREAALRQDADGRLATISCWAGVTDAAANGQAVLWAAAESKDSGLQAAADRMLAYLMRKAPRAADGTLFHVSDKPQVWVDSLFMAPPFLARAGQHEEAVKQIQGMRRRLWLPGKKMFAAVWDEGRNAFERQDCWGVGNGWAAAGITRVAQILPAAMAAEKNLLRAHVRELLDGCLRFLRPDGLYHNVVDDPGSFVETNLAQMLAYAIYRGVADGWLPGAYLQNATMMRRAAWKQVDAYGLVQGVCGSPEFSAPGTATEGQAFFLLMEAARRDCPG